MKKALLSLTVLAVLGTATQAQDTKSTTAASGGTTFGIKIGAGFNNITGKDYNGNSVNNSLAFKWNAGVNAEIPVATGFYFQPGVSIATKGSKTEKTSSTPEYKFNLYYVDVPMTFLYKTGASANKFLIGFGPYVGFGIGGKFIQENGSNDIETDIEFRGTVTVAEAAANPTKRYFKRLDAGVNALAGYEFSKNLSLSVRGQLGLTKMNANYEGTSGDKTKLKNVGFSLDLGYRFGK